MKDPEVFVLAVSEKSPWKAGKEMAENIFESHPEKGGQEKNKPGKGFLNFGKTPGKKGPIKGKIKNENSVDQQAHSGREAAVMSGDCGNPVNQDGVECDASQESEQKGLFSRFIVYSEDKGDEGNPTQEGESELGKRQRSQDSAQDHPQDGNPSDFQKAPLNGRCSLQKKREILNVDLCSDRLSGIPSICYRMIR